MSISILEIALARGVQEDEGSISAGEFYRVGLPFFAGCEHCTASLGPVQSYPSRTGYIRCEDCLGGLGFATVEEFDKFETEANHA